MCQQCEEVGCSRDSFWLEWLVVTKTGLRAARERSDLGTTVKEGQSMCGHTKQTVGAYGSSNCFVC